MYGVALAEFIVTVILSILWVELNKKIAQRRKSETKIAAPEQAASVEPQENPRG